ncbi:MAG TPA: PLP-dependent aminotransferase family protein [Candidatus Faeciplasma gallinarum]|uniref:PLP-dependent aminotransferase family protein n=1 Tax=Candidatus Faeciplasma gallinarum TaxID=2840799 RepID=A0A9D1EPH7_9FIRM|nr:PLP-dependent aminotransferase family protein [Candidatus Faeciplasma gallinarum]
MEYKISNKFVNMKPSAIREIFKSLGKPGCISFAAGNPSPESFPIPQIKEIADDILANDPITALQYGVTEGYAPLRDLVKQRLKRVYNIGTPDDETIIVTGGQQGIELTCKVMCNEGDVVISENPSFIGALNSFRSLGAKLVGVPLKDDGMDIAALENALKSNPKTKLIYTIPSFQNPAGITSTLENRKAVYELARKYDVLIIEDNPYGDLRFAGEDVPTYKSFDTDGRVVYCGSFSKILSAGIRVGTLTANKELVSKIVVAKQVEDVHTNVFFQMVCAKYMSEYDLEGHIEKIRKLYMHKAGLMIAALEKYMPADVKFTRPDGGIFLWCSLPEGYSLDEFVKRCSDKNVFVVPGTAFLPDESEVTRSFRLNYSMPSDEEIDRGIKLLAEVVQQMR